MPANAARPLSEAQRERNRKRRNRIIEQLDEMMRAQDALVRDVPDATLSEWLDDCALDVRDTLSEVVERERARRRAAGIQ